MKTIKLLLPAIALLLFAGNSYSQSTCSSQVIKYSGPQNTEQLATLLNTSADPTIQNLDTATKNSLIKYIVFANGLPAGMSGTDTNMHIYTL